MTSLQDRWRGPVRPLWCKARSCSGTGRKRGDDEDEPTGVLVLAG